MSQLQAIIISVLLTVVVCNVTLTVAHGTCHSNKPYRLSSGELCFNSCQSIPFGDYRQLDDSYNCYSVPRNTFHSNVTLDLHTRLNVDNSVSQQCFSHNMAMFFSWVSYQYDPLQMTGLRFNSSIGYPRLVNCGNWQIINEIHLQTDLLNSHATFAVNDRSGVLIIAFKGTELDAKRWKEMLVDWVFNDFYTKLEQCQLSDQCSTTKVHAGFQRSVLTIRDTILKQTKPYLEAGYLLLFSGHSKGAAMSTMATVMTQAAFNNIPDIKHRIYNMNFGSPLTGNAAFANYYNTIVPDNQTFRFIDRHYTDEVTDDLVTTVPPEWLGYRHVKNPRYIHCDRKWFGNPNPIKGITFQMYPQGQYLPAKIGCHFQESYMDGMLYGPPIVSTTSVKKKHKNKLFTMEDKSIHEQCVDHCIQILEDAQTCQHKCHDKINKEL